jgi:Copper chaperone
MTQIFEVENIKCGGCMNTIRKGLAQMNGVSRAEPDNEKGTVSVDYDAALVSEEAIAAKLSDMGYPLAGQNNLAKKAVSYVSCMIGRVDSDRPNAANN